LKGTALDAPVEALDPQERNVVARIREFGWFSHHCYAEEGSPGFSFTTAFWHTLRFPELIVFSLENRIAHGDDFPCLQPVWPDKANRFPWQDGFDRGFEGQQPDLTAGAWARPS
jgi:Domain of unknown function (DUF4262)